MGNNSKNVLLSIAKNENHLNGILRKYGWFKSNHLSIVQFSEEISESESYFEKVQDHLGNGTLIASKILYKNTLYNCNENSCILTHTNGKKSKFEFGILTKFLIKKIGDKQNVIILYQCTESEYLEDFGLYKISPLPNEYNTVEIDSLALFCPLNLYNANPLSNDSIKVASLHYKPILFSE